jgi:hypothetical protein
MHGIGLRHTDPNTKSEVTSKDRTNSDGLDSDRARLLIRGFATRDQRRGAVRRLRHPGIMGS